jgi:hypothetical protein
MIFIPYKLLLSQQINLIPLMLTRWVMHSVRGHHFSGLQVAMYPGAFPVTIHGKQARL